MARFNAENLPALTTEQWQTVTEYRWLADAVAKRYYKVRRPVGELADYLQEAVIGLAKAVASYDGDRRVPLRSFASTVITRRLNDLRHKEVAESRRVGAVPLWHCADFDDLPDERVAEAMARRDVLEGETSEQVLAYVAQACPAEKAEVFRRAVEGQEYPDIAAAMGVTTGRVAQIIFRIRRLVREKFD